MDNLIRIIDQGDVCTLGFVVVLLLWVGRLMADQRQQYIGSILAAAVLVLFAIRGLLQPITTAEGLLQVTVRSLVASGLTLGASWIVLPLAALPFRFLIRVCWETPKRQSHGRQERRKEWQQREDERRSVKEREDRERKERDEAAERGRLEAGKKQEEVAEATRKEAEKKTELRASIEKWFDEHEALLESYPRVRFHAWLERNLSAGTSLEEQCVAVDQFIEDRTPEVQAAKMKSRSAGSKRINPEDI